MTNKSYAAIYSYLDFRHFLREFCQKLITENPKLSYRTLAQKAGFSSPGYFQMIIDGRRNLSHKSISKICETLGLRTSESKYFTALVHYNQAKTDQERDQRYEELIRLRSKSKSEFLVNEKLSYYADQNIVTIREMVALPDFNEDPSWIQKRLKSNISVEQIKTITEFLLKENLLKRKSDGKLVHASGSPTTTPEVISEDVFKYQCDLLTVAKSSLNEVPAQLRDMTSLTIPIPMESLQLIKDEIKNFREKIVAIINHGSHNFDEIYQLSIQFFPLTTKEKENESETNI